MSDIVKELGEDVLKLTIEDVLKEIEELLIKERQYINEPKMKLLFKRVMGTSDYIPGKYIEEARNSMEKLMFAWYNLIMPLCKDETLNLQIPPISGVTDKMMSFATMDDNFCYKVNEDVKIFEKHIRFKLSKDNAVTNNLDFEIYEDRNTLYLDNESKYKYLKECIDYMNEIRNKEIFRYEKILHSITLSMAKMPNIRDLFPVADIYVFQILGLYSNALFYVNTYLELKLKLIKEELNIIELGLKGEEIINSHLKMYDDEIINLSNIRLEIEGNSIENDNILLTPYGIYVLEVKNLGSSGSYSLKISKDGKWSKIFRDGTIESIEYDATLQNERHIRYLQRYINAKLNRNVEDKDYIKVNGLVIIANNEVDIENQSEQPVFRMSEIYRQISKREAIFDVDELFNLKNTILSNSLEAKKYECYDYLGELKDNFEVFNQQLDFYNVPVKGLSYILISFDKLSEIVERIKQFEIEYNCNLIDKEEFFRNLDMRAINNITQNLVKEYAE